MRKETEYVWNGKRRDAWIETFSGFKLNVFYPDPDCINIIDIAHALSQCTRFNGHLYKFLSVAEHSVNVARFCRNEYKLMALLHDASEAYISDIPRPIKQFIPEIKGVERNLTEIIFKKFGIKGGISDQVKLIDRRMCATEAKASNMNIDDWIQDFKFRPLNFKPFFHEPEKAKTEFLNAYDLYKELK